MRRIEIILPLGCLLLALSMLGSGLLISDYDLAVMNFPIFVCGLTILFSLLLLNQIRASGPALLADTFTGAGRALAMMAMALPALLIFGFEIGLSLFLLFYLLVHKRGILLGFSLSAGCFLLIYGLFEFYFHIPHFQFLLPFI